MYSYMMANIAEDLNSSPSTEYITIKVPKTKTAAFAHSVDLDEVALSEPTLLALCLLKYF